ncbi:protein ABHD11-like isoform X2 [Xyrauchen texanus]|uniref:protein ABHD11-like isoform X2 n=1 Tax=Xyrauchen texanus TaxID=154827 RepID=UPI0022419865|nr:protein ABHD11-like isoform X2 [Xyrauchen texanus]
MSRFAMNNMCRILTRGLFGGPSSCLSVIGVRDFCSGASRLDRTVSPVNLTYDVFDGKGDSTPLVFLHGLFGSKSNFHSIAKSLVQRTGRKVLTVDARNHGKSPHSPVLTYEAMTCDLTHLLGQLHIGKCVLIGHSMGGKVAMTTALSQERSVRQFLLTNLEEQNGEYGWRINLDAIANQMEDIIGFPKFNTTYKGPSLFLGGSSSAYISSEDYPEIQRLFPSADIQYIPDASHWIHADKPLDFISSIITFLQS